MIPFAAIVIGSSASLGIDNVSNALFSLGLSLVFSWGHFSTVWLVKDSQSVEILPDSVAISFIY